MKHLPVILLSLAGLALFAGFAAWAFHEGSTIGGGWSSLKPILPYVIGGLVAVAGLTGGLMWLAFYSSRRGYDEPYDVDKPPPGKRR